MKKNNNKNVSNKSIEEQAYELAKNSNESFIRGMGILFKDEAQRRLKGWQMTGHTDEELQEKQQIYRLALAIKAGYVVEKAKDKKESIDKNTEKKEDKKENRKKSTDVKKQYDGNKKKEIDKSDAKKGTRDAEAHSQKIV